MSRKVYFGDLERDDEFIEPDTGDTYTKIWPNMGKANTTGRVEFFNDADLVIQVESD